MWKAEVDNLLRLCTWEVGAGGAQWTVSAVISQSWEWGEGKRILSKIEILS